MQQRFILGKLCYRLFGTTAAVVLLIINAKGASTERPAPPLPATPRQAVSRGINPPVQVGFLPSGQLFDPLIADPRWPHFSAAYQQFMLEYFDGHSPNGQFYGRSIQYISFGTHFYY